MISDFPYSFFVQNIICKWIYLFIVLQWPPLKITSTEMEIFSFMSKKILLINVMILHFRKCQSINYSLPMCQWIWSTLVQIMACRLFGAKPLSKPMILYCQLDPKGQTEWKFNQNTKCLTHWGRATHICVGKLTTIGSDDGLSPGRRQAIIWTNAGILLIGPLGTNFSEILIEIHTFSSKKMHLKMSSGKWQPFCLCLNVLIKIQNV